MDKYYIAEQNLINGNISDFKDNLEKLSKKEIVGLIIYISGKTVEKSSLDTIIFDIWKKL